MSSLVGFGLSNLQCACFAGTNGPDDVQRSLRFIEVIPLNASDYDGAITNARTLIEEILLSIEEQLEGTRQPYDGNLMVLYKSVSKQINLYPDDSQTGNSFNEILRGFISIINGFAGISNSIADRHATAKHPRKHHAKIAVNSAMIIADFLLDSFEYQQSKAKSRT